MGTRKRKAKTRGTHHGYVTKLVPSYCKELEGGDDEPRTRDVPKGKYDYGVDHNLEGGVRAWTERTKGEVRTT